MTDEVDRTWPHWADALGNLIYPGDTIAIATINGRSPQLVIAEVERINRLNSRGEEITESVREMGKWKSVPSCSITAKPILDARGFVRWGTKFSKDNKVRSVTYQIPSNIIKINFKEEE